MEDSNFVFNTATTENSESSQYTSLLEGESQIPNPEEIIRIDGVVENSAEFELLSKSGIPAKDIVSGNLKRGDLLEAGFVFLNKIGGGEKPIITTVSVSQEQSNTIDFSSRVLLTADELSLIIANQDMARSSLKSKEMEDVRKSMLEVLEEADSLIDLRRTRAIDLFKKAQQFITTSDKFDDSQIRSFQDFIARQFSAVSEGGTSELDMFFVESCINGVDVLKIHGIPFEVYPSRASVLQGQTSPFLNSGFHFNKIVDITLFPNQKDKTRRLNTVVVHLLSQGLDESGSSRNDSHDQTYITAEEYVELFYTREVVTDEEWSEEDLFLVAQKILARSVQN